VLQYKIPQNVGIEDKIVGPFSLRQLIILAIGVGISYTIFAIASRIYELSAVEYFVIALPALFALMLAVIKVHNVTFGRYLLLLAEFAIKPKKRMWDHRGIAYIVDPDLTDKSTSQKTKGLSEEEKSKKNVNLSDLSTILDSGGFDHVQKTEYEDIDEADDDDLITEAYFGHKRAESNAENMYWRTKEMQKKKLELLAKMPTQKKEIPAQNQPPTPAPATTEKKESVVENLAKVIQEAKENNKNKRNRPRNKKPRPPQPVRQNTQINTTNKQTPQLINKDTSEKETSLGDLKEGGEIEINLQ
jgi:hypothetical protein